MISKHETSPLKNLFRTYCHFMTSIPAVHCHSCYLNKQKKTHLTSAVFLYLRYVWYITFHFDHTIILNDILYNRLKHEIHSSTQKHALNLKALRSVNGPIKK